MGSERPENCPVDSFQWRTGGSPGKGVATIEDAELSCVAGSHLESCRARCAGFETPGKRACVLVFSEERAAALGTKEFRPRCVCVSLPKRAAGYSDNHTRCEE